MEEYYLYTFESTHAAIATDKLLKPVGSVVMPVPRFLSSSCGISVRIDVAKHEEAEQLFMEKSHLKPYVSEDEECDYHYYHVVIDKENNNIQCDRVEL